MSFTSFGLFNIKVVYLQKKNISQNMKRVDIGVAFSTSETVKKDLKLIDENNMIGISNCGHLDSTF